MLNKIFYYAAQEGVEGDYLEFGVYNGSSFCHAIRAYKNSSKFEINQSNITFYGFDSFEGFGKIDDNDKHPFFVDSNFKTNFNKKFSTLECVIQHQKKSVHQYLHH
jgi:hypothetical protein